MVSPTEESSGQELIGTTLNSARLLAGGLSAGLLVFLTLSGFVELPELFGFWLVPVAALAGLLSPVLGYRAYELVLSRVIADSALAARCQAFLKANLVAFAITESVGLFGLVVFLMAGRYQTLIGVVTHVILVGALWPTPERLKRFLEIGEPAGWKG